MNKSPRCLYENDFRGFLHADEKSIMGTLIENCNGQVQSTQVDAWKEEISILHDVVFRLSSGDGHIVFEYDIPRLGKRVDVALLYRGIIFCIEFKVGQSIILESDIDQVFDYALDLKNFHKFSEDKIIVPILVATNYSNYSTQIQVSAYDDKVINHISKKAIEQKEYGARPILRIIQDEIEDKVTDIILSDEDTRNIKITIGDNNEVVQI